MNILVIHSHNGNRGDEAAVKSMIDELLVEFPTASIVISNTDSTPYPNMPVQVRQISRFPKLNSKSAQLEFFIALVTSGNITFTKEGKNFIKVLKSCDLVIHAPGGPAIGDIYYQREWLYLWRLSFICRLKIPYVFYAPSMGPFNKEVHNKLRKRILSGAERIILRDPISVKYVKELLPGIRVEQALDSALQHEITEEYVKQAFDGYEELKTFLDENNKVIGVTVTDLKWHPKHKSNPAINNIENAFQRFIDERIGQGYGIMFIPQLYGDANDTVIMEKYMRKEHTFMLDAFQEKYDSYFQQYVLGKLYAVVGMRYHSNIFSAKMGTPFVSVSYEQKMKGFMQSIELSDYCIDINVLSFDILNKKFQMLIDNYEDYRLKLKNSHEYMRTESRKTTEAVVRLLNSKR